ncbi:MAG: DUF429 domain-containing protein [Proteobacteria bacterium]|nr:DUF429 domain-containing protein [Pseudomonadota bacterium]
MSVSAGNGKRQDDVWLAGIDGCRGGWLAAFVSPQSGEVRARVARDIAAHLFAPEAPAVIAIDIPIGLPQRAGPGGRAAEAAVRPLIGRRRSSVFSVPARDAVYAGDYLLACRAALASSDPPRKVSRQLFGIAPKIREVDALLRADAALAARVFEVHPEVAFWRLNDERALDEPKRVKGRPYEPGLLERGRILIAAGFGVGVVDAPAPAGASADDLLDALACAAIALRIHAGEAQPFPPLPPRDEYGLAMAIWS